MRNKPIETTTVDPNTVLFISQIISANEKFISRHEKFMCIAPLPQTCELMILGGVIVSVPKEKESAMLFSAENAAELATLRQNIENAKEKIPSEQEITEQAFNLDTLQTLFGKQGNKMSATEASALLGEDTLAPVIQP